MRDATGVVGLDEVLNGGLPSGQLYLVEGSGGAGKTTVGLQFLLEGVKRGERVLWCTLAETVAQLEATANAHHWSLEGIDIVNLAEVDTSVDEDSDGYSFFSPSDIELTKTIKKILDTTSRVNPRRVVFDPFSDVKLLARDPLRFRRQLLRLRDHFAQLGATVLLIQEAGLGDEQDAAGEGVAHGVIGLYQHAPDFGKQRRRLRVKKMRGVAFREGFHDLAIRTGGVVVYPRLVANEHDEEHAPGSLSSGVQSLDAMLNGGIDFGTSMLITGPSGVGKSTICMQFADALAAKGGKSAFYIFDETKRAFFGRADALGLLTRQNAERGLIEVRQVDPAEFSPGEFAHLARRDVEQRGSRLVVIDSLNGYMAGMPDESHLAMHMHELLSYLSNRNICTLVTLNQQGIVGEEGHSPVDVTYLTDTALLVRYFESCGELRRALAVVKRRIGAHDARIHELRIRPPGFELLESLEDLSGILTGRPQVDPASRTKQG